MITSCSISLSGGSPTSLRVGLSTGKLVLEEVLGYIDIFRPSQVSFDQFQGDAPMQWLRKQISSRGFDTQIQLKFRTNERNWKQSETFKTALYHGLVHAPNDTLDTNWSKLELRFLVKKASHGKFPRVDKQDVGPVQTKDMADCIMEVTEQLIGNIVARNVREELTANSFIAGSQGGYQIGGTLQGVQDAPELSAFYGNGRKGEQNLKATQRNRGRGRGPVKTNINSRLRGISRGR
jgi:hypothetical protein